MTRRILPAIFLAGASCLPSQEIDVGVLGGLTTLDPDRFSSGESKRYFIGPTLEARFFQRRIGVEVSALYRRFGNSLAFGPLAPPAEYSGPPPISQAYSRFRANSWELPVIGKYYFGDGDSRWRPFLGTGYVMRMQWGEHNATTYFSGNSTPVATHYKSRIGLVFGGSAVAGVEFRNWRGLSIQPQLRYTRFSEPSGGPGVLNQLDFGFGIRF